MLECAKTHLQQFRISKFSGEDPRNLLFKGRGGKGGQGERGEREGGRGRIGKGRDMGGKEGRNGVGRGARHGLPPPARDKLWIRPWSYWDYNVRHTAAFSMRCK